MIDRNTAMARLTRGALLLAAVLVCGCGGDDEGGDGADDGDGGEGTETFTCFASLAPTTFDYVVSGDLLEVSGGGTTETWERVDDGDPTRLVHGTWHVGEQTTPGVGVVSFDLVIEPDQVSARADCDFGSVSASAEAVSPAEITDTSIVILESDEDVQVVTR
jgi:hypothetical protein